MAESAEEADGRVKFMWYVYALSGKSGRIYIGMTSNLRRRFTEHQKGNTYTTKRMGDLRVIFYEAFLNKKDASVQEKFYKTGYGREVLKNKLSNTLNQ